MLCDGLKLNRIAAEWSVVAEWAATQEATHGDFLEQVLSVEC